MIDIKELRQRGYEDESIMLMLRQEIENNVIPEEPDYDEDPMGWVEYWSGQREGVLFSMLDIEEFKEIPHI